MKGKQIKARWRKQGKRGESLKTFARRLARDTELKIHVFMRFWLERKGCAW